VSERSARPRKERMEEAREKKRAFVYAVAAKLKECRGVCPGHGRRRWSKAARQGAAVQLVDCLWVVVWRVQEGRRRGQRRREG
jgi:hypothetical protein